MPPVNGILKNILIILINILINNIDMYFRMKYDDMGGETMIKCNLSLYMGRDRKKIQDVVNETGLARNTVGNLYRDKASRIDYDTIDKLCRMFHIGVGELLEYVEDEEKVSPAQNDL